MTGKATTLLLSVKSTRPVAQHQADRSPSLVVEEDCSGTYKQVNRNTLYWLEGQRYLELTAAGIQAALTGAPLRVHASSFS